MNNSKNNMSDQESETAGGAGISLNKESFKIVI